MSDTTAQPTVSQQADDNLDAVDTAAALQRITSAAGLSESAFDEVREHVLQRVQREAMEHGQSPLQQKWLNREKAPDDWQAEERRIAAELIVRSQRFRPTVQCQQPVDEKGEVLTAYQLANMSDRDLEAVKARMEAENIKARRR